MLDATPVLDEQLLQLGRWIADYYLAPIGEVFRTMLPLNAEFKRSIGYRLTDSRTHGAAPGRSVRIVRPFAPHARRTSRRIPRARLSGSSRIRRMMHLNDQTGVPARLAVLRARGNDSCACGRD